MILAELESLGTRCILITLGLIGRQPPVVIKLSHSEGNVFRAAPSHSALCLPLMACVEGLVS